jgi:hypothetical protein
MKLVRKCWALALLVVLSYLGPLKNSAQITTTGSVEGVVLDQQGKPIRDANVYANLEKDMRRPVATTTTDSAGKFLLRDLPAERVYIYAYKESDGYPNGFAAFFALPNDQSLVVMKVEAGQTTSLTIKRGARSAHLKVHVTDENGSRIGAGLRLTREDQPGGDYITGTDGDVSMLVPPVPFRVMVDEDGYEPWHYGGANYASKAGLVTLKSGQTLTLNVRLRKK